MKNKALPFVFGFIVLVSISSCAEPIAPTECITETPDGFLYGLLHGVITPFAFIISLFTDDVAIYSVCNTGAWYDFGYVLGLSIILGASGRSSK